jgi:hypothetical protein
VQYKRQKEADCNVDSALYITCLGSFPTNQLFSLNPSFLTLILSSCDNQTQGDNIKVKKQTPTQEPKERNTKENTAREQEKTRRRTQTGRLNVPIQCFTDSNPNFRVSLNRLPCGYRCSSFQREVDELCAAKLIIKNLAGVSPACQRLTVKVPAGPSAPVLL